MDGSSPLSSTGLSEVIALFRAHGSLSRSDIMRLTGLSRSTVAQRVSTLSEAGLVRPVGAAASTGGRPPSTFAVPVDQAIILAADIGASGFQASSCDLFGEPLETIGSRVDVASGPEVVLGMVAEAFAALADRGEVWGVGVGVPGSVHPQTGRILDPSIMQGWYGYDIREVVRRTYDVPVVVERDANAKALAEARSRDAETETLVAVKFGTAVGAGIVEHGRILRGRNGAAGGIGHSQAVLPPGTAPRLCACGMSGCLEAHAGGRALVEDLVMQGVAVEQTSDVVRLARAGVPAAREAVRRAARIVGESLATLISTVSPDTLVIGGQFAECGDLIHDMIAERIYRHTLPLVSRELRIEMSGIDSESGVRGLASITADAIFSQENLEVIMQAKRDARDLTELQ